MDEERINDSGVNEKVDIESDTGTKEAKLPSKKKRYLWSILSIAIAALTVWAVIAQSKSFSLAKFAEEIGHANPWWLLSAFISMLCYIGFEALAILCILREFGHRKSFREGLVYSSADIYFSAITPSATGGQPASAFFMHRDGISTTLAAVVLLANLLMYSCSTVIMGIFSTAIAPLTITRFNTVSKIFVIVGYFFQVALLVLIFLLITREKIILSVGKALIGFLGKLRIFKNPEAKIESFERSMQDYRDHVAVLKGKRKMLGKVLIFNLLQRMTQILVTVFTYLALGNPLHAIRAFSLQAYISIGAYCIPIPGSMGITDYLMIDGFSRIENVPSIMTESRTLTFELLSRTLSFYSCIIICGITVLISYLVGKHRRDKL